MRDERYLKKIVAKARERNVPVGLQHAIVAHDDWCTIFKGGKCSCDPDVELVPDGPQG